jgi:hypothetical protein
MSRRSLLIVAVIAVIALALTWVGLDSAGPAGKAAAAGGGAAAGPAGKAAAAAGAGAGAGGKAAAGSGAGDGVLLHVQNGDGLMLSRPGATAQLRVGATIGGRQVPVPGALEYASSDPAAISVSRTGLVTALADPGSAVITVSSPEGAVAAAVTVAAVQLTGGTTNLSPAEVISLSPGRLTLIRDPATLRLTDGSIVVDAPGGLVARLSDVAAGATSVTAATTRVPLTEAFRELDVGLSTASTAARVRISGGNAVVTDAASQVVLAAASGVQFSCTTTSGASASLTVTPPSATLTVTGELAAHISIHPGNGFGVTLEVGAAVSGSVSLGSVQVDAQGTYQSKCKLTNLPNLNLPLPVGLPPVGTLAVAVTPSFTATINATASGTATVVAPVITDTWSAVAGITYSEADGWSPLNTESTPDPQVSNTEVTASASISASVSLGARLVLGIAVRSGGVKLAAADLAWAEIDGTLAASLASPFSDLDFGYLGPAYYAGAELSAGLQIQARRSALTQLLAWIGIKPPVFNTTLFDTNFPLLSQPVPTVSSADATLTAGQTTDVLTSQVPSSWDGTDVDFVLFPAGAPRDQATGTVVASATAAGGVATAQWQPGADLTPGTYVLVADLNPAGFLPFPSAPSGQLTIVAGAASPSPSGTPAPSSSPSPTGPPLQLPSTIYITEYLPESPGGEYLSVGGIQESADGQFTGTEVYSPPDDWGPLAVTGSIDGAGNITFTWVVPYEPALPNAEQVLTGTAVQQPDGQYTMSGSWCIEQPPGSGCEPQGTWAGSSSTYPPPS